MSLPFVRLTAGFHYALGVVQLKSFFHRHCKISHNIIMKALFISPIFWDRYKMLSLH